MKKIIFSTMIASLLAFVGCQNEELVKESTDNSGKKVTLTAHIAGSADSRVALEEKTEGGKTFINVGWEASGEKFTMYNANLSSFALFSQVKNNQFECDNFNLGDGVKYAYYGYAQDRTYDHLSTQNGMLDKSKVLMKAEVTDLSDIEFGHKTAIVKFTFIDDGETNINEDIEQILIDNVKNLSDTKITVSRADVPDNKKCDIYVFLPIENQDDYVANHQFDFNVTAGDSEYIGSLTISKTIDAGNRYTATVALEEKELVGCNLPEGVTFRNAVESFLKEGDKQLNTITFIADPSWSPQGKGTRIGESDAYMVANDNILEIRTQYDVFIFHENCNKMFYANSIGFSTGQLSLKIRYINFGNNVNTSKVEDMSEMFSCGLLESLDLSSFNTKNVTTMRYMFSGCRALSSVNLSSFDTSNVTDMSSMFYYCTRQLTSLDLSSFNTENVTTMSNMFNYCMVLQEIIFDDSFVTGKVMDMRYMFAECYALTSLDLTVFTFSDKSSMESTNVQNIFDNIGQNAGVTPIPIKVTENGYNHLNKYYPLTGSNAKYVKQDGTDWPTN